MVFKPRAGAPGAPDHGQAIERVHHVLYDQVGLAVEAIAHLETQWSPQELTKRIVRYIYNAAKNEELVKMPFEEAAVQLVENSMHSYNASCGEKEWFFDLDLVPAYSAAAWELVRGQRGATFSRVQAKVCAQYEEQLDGLLLNKAMWEAVNKTFQDDTVRSKMFGALSKTYHQAFDATIADRRPMQDLERVQGFLSRWMTDSMSRVWSAFENLGGEQVLSDANVTKLFQNMLKPFGEDHQYSCVPALLTERIGQPPPRKWAFVGKEVRALMNRWRSGVNEPAAKRRKSGKSRGAGEGDAFNAFNAFAAPVEPEAGVDEEDEGEAADGEEEGADAEGHPLCTSAEDCIGGTDVKLVRHLLNGGKGDIYCSTCWRSFLDTNPSLQGVEEEC